MMPTESQRSPKKVKSVIIVFDDGSSKGYNYNAFLQVFRRYVERKRADGQVFSSEFGERTERFCVNCEQSLTSTGKCANCLAFVPENGFYCGYDDKNGIFKHFCMPRCYSMWTNLKQMGEKNVKRD